MLPIPHEADGKQKLKHFLLQKRYAAGLCNSACQIHWLMSLKHIKGATFIMSATLTQIITNYVNLYFPLGNDQIQCVAI